MDAAEIARRFDLGAAAQLSDGPVARGRQGDVWRLDTAEASWAVKVPRQRSNEAELRPAAEFQESACRAGVPTPAVRRTSDGCVVADVGGNQVRVYEWVDLLPPDLRLDPALVGAAVAAIHRLGASSPGPLDPWYREAVGPQRWDHVVEQLRHAGAPFANQLADLREELVALEMWIEPAVTLRTCHRDLWADNVRPTPDGGICVIDWENSGPADPCHELGCVLFEFARDDPGRARTLVEAYRGAAGPGRVDRPGHFSMLIAQLGHITEIAAMDWLQPNSRSPDRTAAADWISEVLDDPHTRERLHRLLDAVRGTPNQRSSLLNPAGEQGGGTRRPSPSRCE